jgi:hypothetical protein
MSLTGCDSHGGFGFEFDRDPVSRSVDAKIIRGTSATSYYRILDDDLYLDAEQFRLDAERDWVHLDLAKVSDTSWLKSAFDGGATNTTAGVVSAVKLGEGSYAGTIDLHVVQEQTKYATPKADLANQIDAMGEADSSAVPFVAKLDDRGRLTFMELTTRRSNGSETCHTTEVTHVDAYGDPVSVTRPDAGAVEEASEELYDRL